MFIRTNTCLVGCSAAGRPAGSDASALAAGRQQRQRERHAGLRPHDPERGGVPVDVLELQPDHLPGAEAVDAHHQQERVVAQASRCGGSPPSGVRRCTSSHGNARRGARASRCTRRHRRTLPVRRKSAPWRAGNGKTADTCSDVGHGRACITFARISIRNASIVGRLMARQDLPCKVRYSRNLAMWSNFPFTVCSGLPRWRVRWSANARSSAVAGGGRFSTRQAGTLSPITWYTRLSAYSAERAFATELSLRWRRREYQRVKRSTPSSVSSSASSSCRCAQ